MCPTREGRRCRLSQAPTPCLSHPPFRSLSTPPLSGAYSATDAGSLSIPTLSGASSLSVPSEGLCLSQGCLVREGGYRAPLRGPPAPSGIFGACGIRAVSQVNLRGSPDLPLRRAVYVRYRTYLSSRTGRGGCRAPLRREAWGARLSRPARLIPALACGFGLFASHGRLGRARF